jgi:DNA invertase Pin-like site-specific DNA recombinase
MMTHQRSSTGSATEQTAQPRAFSYLRFSTPEQQRGDSFRRQSTRALAWCERNGIELDERPFHDFGVSAFHGKNATAGRLAEFIAAVQDGSVPKGSYLLIESMDRLSRMKARHAVRLLEDIVDMDITVVTLADGREYSTDVLDNDPMALMYALMVAIRAREESATKSERLSAVWNNKRSQAATSRKVMTKQLPAWCTVDKESGDICLIPERVQVIREVFAWSLQGVGLQGIAKRLNERGEPTWGYRGRKPAEFWQRSYVKKLRENPAVTGVLVPRSRVKEAECSPVPDYFPRVISDEDFEAIRAMAGDHRAPKAVSHLLAGLARCPKCGSTMTRVSKGQRSSGPKLVCTRAKAGGGCDYRSVPVAEIEDGLKFNLGYTLANMPTGDESLDDELTDVDQMLEGTQDAINALYEQMEQTAGDAARKHLGERLDDYLGEVRRLEDRRKDIWARMERGSVHSVRARAERLEDLIGAGDTVEANAVLRSVLLSVVVDYRVGQLVLSWVQGGESRVDFGCPF